MRLNHSLIGFDCDTRNVHYAVCKDGRIVETGKLASTLHLKGLRETHNLTDAIIEEICYVNNRRVTIKLSEAVGRVRQQCDEAKIPHTLISVASWKKLAIGNSRATKAEVKALIVATEDVLDDLTQDEYDACGIAIAGYGLARAKAASESP